MQENTQNTRPFRVLGLQQVALGQPERGPLQAFWSELLGVQSTGSYRSERENVDEDILTLGRGPFAIELDLMAPIDIEGRPRVHEPALNHIGIWIDDLSAAYTWLQTQGVRFTPGGIRRGASGHDVCFIHPKGSVDAPRNAHGVLLELVQAPRSVIEAFDAAAPNDPKNEST